MEETMGFALYYWPRTFCEGAKISLQEEKEEIDNKESQSKVDCI